MFGNQEKNGNFWLIPVNKDSLEMKLPSLEELLIH